MSQFITFDEFKRMPIGSDDIMEDEFDTLSFYADKVITTLTFGQAKGNIPEVKEAAAAQIAYLHKNGGVSAANSGSRITSENIGSYSYSVENDEVEAIGGVKIGPAVKVILLPTGLLRRSVFSFKG